VRDKVSHAHIYRARVSRDDFHRELIGEILGGMLSGSSDSFVSAFVDIAEQAGPQHLARLEALVNERRKKRKGPGP
jgi:predicted transcriptional regulator